MDRASLTRYQVLISFGVLLVVNFLMAQKYQLEDLKVLKNHQSYQEFFHHYYDIKPSLRLKEWKSLGVEVMKSYLEGLNIEKMSISLQKLSDLFSKEPFKADEELWYILNRQLKKNLAQLNSEQRELVMLLVSSSPIHDDQFYWTLFLKPKLFNQEKLLQKLLNHETAEFYCSRKQLVEKLLTLTKPEILKLNLRKTCQKALIQTLVKNPEIYAPNLYQALTLSAPKVMKKNSTHSSLQDDMNILIFYSMLYSTSLDKKDWHLFTENIQELKEKPKVRNAILITLKAKEFYPDQIFQTLSEKKLDAWLRLMHLSFPKYIDHYIETCLNYMSGEKKYAQGPPVSHCHIFFQKTTQSPYVLKHHQELFKKHSSFIQ